ncbi:MAG: hypothetical protein ACI35O_15510 [Bacillaceae bacterium]
MTDKQEKRVLQFPNLKKRLLERGYEALNHKQFEVAYECFSQMREYGYESNESELAVVICLVELNELKEAKERCEALLFEAKPIVTDAIEIYLSILVQLHDYKEIADTLQWLKEQRNIDQTHLEKLMSLMDFAKKQQKFEEEKQEDSSQEKELEAVLLHSSSVAQQLGMIHGLKNSNIRMYLPILKDYLKKEDAHPIVKTTILLLLMEQGVNEEIEVQKFGQAIMINPVTLKPSTEEPFTWEVLDLLEKEIESENPTMYGLLKEYYIQYLYTIFPLTYAYSKEEYAAALYYFGSELQGLQVSKASICEQFGLVDDKNLIILHNHFIDLEKYNQFDV